MTIEKPVPEYLDWLFSSQSIIIMAACFGLAVAVVFFCYLLTAIRRGPAEGFYAVAKAIFGALGDLIQASPRRILAVAILAIQESIRRRVLLTIFVVLVVMLMFAAWFLDPGSDNPARLYISVIMNLSIYLVLPMVLLLSAFSLPADIKNRTIYTVVTKPVRASEIVLGRILGFAAIGTVMLLFCGIVSYVFVIRGLSHTHEHVQGVSDEDVEANSTTASANHRHRIETPDGEVRFETHANKGHRHEVIKNDDGSYDIGPAVGMLRAKVPVYGTLKFLGRDGKPTDKGVNVGDEWQYRSYIEGQTGARAIWTFNNVTKDQFPDGLPVELTIQVFRTYKGDIEQRIFGEIWLKNPSKNIVAKRKVFQSQEFTTQKIFFDSEDLDRDMSVVTKEESEMLDRGQSIPSKLNLFDDLVDENGQLEVWIACAERSQYFGMATPDIYLKAADNSFFVNFVKGYVGIWFQMIIVVSFGVMFSTFLNGPVSLMGTLVVITFGIFKAPIIAWGKGEVEGGGSVESMIRIATQDNVMTDLSMNDTLATIIKVFDLVIMKMLRAVAELLPSFGDLNTATYVANGFNVDGNLLAINATLALAYFVVLSILGLFFLKSRELAA